MIFANKKKSHIVIRVVEDKADGTGKIQIDAHIEGSALAKVMAESVALAFSDGGKKMCGLLLLEHAVQKQKARMQAALDPEDEEDAESSESS